VGTILIFRAVVRSVGGVTVPAGKVVLVSE